MKKVIILTGPTAVGKTKLALSIARKYNFAIINGDAYQVYKYLDIGVAKPTLEERSQCEHKLFDFLDPKEEFSICDYQKLVRTEIENNPNPSFIVGGSGLYINSVIYDYQFDQVGRDSNFEIQYQNYSNHELYLELLKYMPDAINKIHENNRKRVLRALEIALNGDDINRNNEHQLVYDALVIFLTDTKDTIYDQINQRVDQMVEDGFIEEAKKLKDYPLSTTSMSAIGYKEMFLYLDHKLELDEALNKIKQKTRNFAKRQFTWFKHKTRNIEVSKTSKTFAEVFAEVSKLIDEHLQN